MINIGFNLWPLVCEFCSVIEFECKTVKNTNKQKYYFEAKNLAPYKYSLDFPLDGIACFH